MSEARVPPTDQDQQALETLLEQLILESAAALDAAEQWFSGDMQAMGRLSAHLFHLENASVIGQMDAIATIAASCRSTLAEESSPVLHAALAEQLVTLNARLADLSARDSGAPRPPLPFSGPATSKLNQQSIAKKVLEPAGKLLAAFRRGPEARPPVEALLKLARTFERAAGTEAEFEPWWLARMILEALQTGTLAPDLVLYTLLADLEVFIVALADDQPLADPAWVAQAASVLAKLDSGSEEIALVVSRYGIQTESSDEMATARRAVVRAVQEELDRVRDSFDMFVRSGGQDADLLQPACERLERVERVLRVSAMDEAEAVLRDARDAMLEVIAGRDGSDAASLIADSLLHAGEVLDSGSGGPAERLRTEALAAVIVVALELLARVRPGLSEISEMEESDRLDDAPRELRELADVLDVAGFHSAADVTRVASERVANLDVDTVAPEQLAEALVCLELALDSWREGGSGSEALLQRAQAALVISASVASREDSQSAAEPPVVSDGADADILAVFLEEAREHMVSARTSFARLRDTPADAKARVELQRAFHTLKGSGRMAGTLRLAEFSWGIESLLKRVIEGSLDATPAVIELVGVGLAVLPALLEQIESGTNPGLDLAPLHAVALDPTKLKPGLAAAIFPTLSVPKLEVVRRWIAANRGGKGSGRVPQAVLDALQEVRIVADLLGAPDVAGVVGGLHQQLTEAIAPEGTLLDQIDAAVGRLIDGARSVDHGLRDEGAIDDYRDEARTLLDRMGDACDALLLDAGDTEAVLALQRVVHTLKGSSRVAGFRELSEIAQETERVLKAVGEERMVVTPRLIWMMQRVFDAMYGMLDSDGASAGIRARELISGLQQVSSDDRSVPDGAERRRRPRVSVDSEKVRSDQFDRALVRALSLGLRSAQMQSRMTDQTIWNVASISDMLKALLDDATAIRESLIRARTAPVHLHADRWRRVVRQAAEDSGRTAELRFEGSEAEVDRRLLDAIVMPVEHLLRNAVVHGIEPEAERRAAGKSATGTVIIRASVDDTGIMLEVDDDGRGIDVVDVMARADDAAGHPVGRDVSQEELLGIIAAPGFSTAGEMTYSSGYGMGLNAVIEAVREMGGKVRMETTARVGTRFVLHLPNPSPVMSVELFRIGNALIAVPTSGVVLARSTTDGSSEGVNHDGEVWPFVEIGPLIGVLGAEADEESSMAVLLRHDGRGVALRFDEPLGKIETAVHRLLGGDSHENGSVAGVGLLDGGRLATVLNVESLLDAAPETVCIRPLAVVADDSPTAREEVVRKLEAAGWRVIAIHDGIEARKTLAKEKPALVVLDIDMPGHDGLEVLEWARTRKSLEHVPVIIVSAALDEHRRARAASLHAHACVEKPFRGEEFEAALTAIRA